MALRRRGVVLMLLLALASYLVLENSRLRQQTGSVRSRPPHSAAATQFHATQLDSEKLRARLIDLVERKANAAPGPRHSGVSTASSAANDTPYPRQQSQSLVAPQGGGAMLVLATTQVRHRKSRTFGHNCNGTALAMVVTLQPMRTDPAHSK